MSGVHFGPTGHHAHALPAPQPRQQLGLHRVPAGWKAAAALAIVVATMLMPHRWIAWHATVLAMLATTVLTTRIPVRPLVMRLIWFSPFVLGAAAGAMLQGPAGPGWQAVALRGVTCLATMLVLNATTSFVAVIEVLRRIHVPALLLTTLMLMERYLHVLGSEARRMRRARMSRTMAASRRVGWLLSADVISRLFVRASERAERIYLAMCARGWK